MNTRSRTPSDDAALAAMVARRPADRELIEETFANDARFRRLCRDYLNCRRALETANPSSGFRQLEAEIAEEARLWMLVIRAEKRRQSS